ncbi:hypothetical protein LTR36_007438 [Oleoguttula mirabilis]|uniref:Carrier domain-containing protein n=1 Tax=Oleoguttula mirabilis TaxID=1507867 RepID=A0AAV9J9D7_9PEZI|nr:hypothetical protein LTR36_007438 [Oleoguttula mirabilis]
MDEQLRRLWSEALGRSESDIHDDTNFFDAGGDSVTAIKLAGLANHHGVQLHAQTIFNSPVFAEMASQTSRKEGSSHSKQASQQHTNGQANVMDSWHLINTCLAQCDIPNHALEDIAPCTPYQAELMRTCHEQGAWMFQAVFEVGKGSLARAKETLQIIRDKNPAFRTRIVQHEKGLFQVVLREKIHWSEVSEELEAYKARDVARRMCYGDPLYRYTVVHDTEKTYIVWTKTHAVYDRWSKMHLMEDIRECFLDPVAFTNKPARPPFRDFVDFVQDLDAKEGMEYWTSQLQGMDDNYQLLFPEAKDTAFLTSTTHSIRKTIPYSKPTQAKISFDALVQVGWALTLANVSGSDDIFFCTFRSCRQMALSGIQDIIGPLWSLIPVRRCLDAQQTLQSLLEDVYDSTIAGIPHEPFGIPALEQHFGHKRFLQSVILPQPPQPDTFSAGVTARDEEGSEYSLQSSEKLWGQTRGHYGLYIMLTPKQGGMLDVWARYDDRFLDAERVESIIGQYTQVLEKLFAGNWHRTSVHDYCPHLSVSEDADEERQPNEAMQNGDTQPQTLTHLFRNRSQTAPAVIIPSQPPLQVSHADLRKHVSDLQAEFARLGIGKGSAVSIALPNSLELIAVFLAATWQRGIAAPLNPAYKQDEFEFYIDDLGSALVVVPQGAFKADGAAVKAARKYKAAIAECYWDGKKIVLDVKEEGNLGKEGCQEILEAEEDDVALVLHTSGTTGRPKAVPLSNANLMASIDNICRTYQLTPKDRTMLIMPLFHVHGLLASFLSPLYSGGSAIIPPRLEPSFWETFVRYKANWYTGTPSMHRLILQFPPPEPVPDIRFIRSCSSQLAPSLYEKLEKAYKAPVLESYAMTEASHLMTSNPLPPAKHFPGTVGQGQGTVQVRILDTEGTEVAQGGEGEVCIRGPNVTKGYLNNEEANQSSFTKDGFFRTGDQGKLDQDGYLTLTGRLKEMINKGGEKISPVELDNVISQHSDVAEAVTFAIDDEGYGQDVGCAVKLADGKEMDEQALKKWIGEKVAAHKVPKKIWFPSEIPKTATGKVQRKLVAEKVAKSDGSDGAK